MNLPIFAIAIPLTIAYLAIGLFIIGMASYDPKTKHANVAAIFCVIFWPLIIIIAIFIALRTAIRQS